jgi:hypothetical protein
VSPFLCLHTLNQYSRFPIKADVPRITEMRQTGSGTKLIERAIPDATVRRDFRPEGLVCPIELPLPDKIQFFP